MTLDDGPTATLLVVNNIAGGKESHVDIGSRSGAYRELVASVDGMLSARAGAVLCLQEATTAEPGLPTSVAELEELGVATSYVPRMSTSWYPVGAKWNRWTTVPESRASSEGLCVGLRHGGLALQRWGTATDLPDADSRNMVLDLPLVTFATAEEAASPLGRAFIQAEWPAENESPVRLHFRHTYYHGNRDSDPRIAQACLVGVPNGEDGQLEALYVLVNIHLSTIREERPDADSDSPYRKNSPRAQFLRHMQLSVVAEFIRDIRRSLNLPVILAGDLNAEPGSPEIREFCRAADMEPLLKADICWRCGTTQRPRSPLAFYRAKGGGFGLTMEPNKPGDEPVLTTSAVCSNDECLEPRFTHKVTGLLVDNVLISRPNPDDLTMIESARPELDLSPAYTDHAVLSVPLRVVRTTGKRGSIA